MASKNKVIDAYANMAAKDLAESVAGTAIYSKFDFPYSIMDKMALVIARLEYTFLGLTNLNSAGDQIVAALLAAASVVTLETVQDPLIIDSARVARIDYGAAASGMIYEGPVTKDFTDLPGGGLLIAPNPLYLGVQSTGAASACGVRLRLYYTYLQLETDEYWQLVESRRVIT